MCDAFKNNSEQCKHLIQQHEGGATATRAAKLSILLRGYNCVLCFITAHLMNHYTEVGNQFYFPLIKSSDELTSSVCPAKESPSPLSHAVPPDSMRNKPQSDVSALT